MKKLISMRGAEIDLGKLMARQEKNITVGNTKSNARGDQLGEGGKIVKSADELAREHYNRNDPKAVVQGGIKADDTPEINTKKVVVDDWEEPLSEAEAKDKPTPKTQAENKAFSPDSRENPPEAEADEEEDPWVEDKQGNFVRQSELQGDNNESVSKSKKGKKSKGDK
jgi:hypothetical protein